MPEQPETRRFEDRGLLSCLAVARDKQSILQDPEDIPES